MATPARQRGMTLIEIMVALVIGLVLIAGAGQIFISSKQAYRTSEAVSRIQESGRTALLLMARDIRQAGYWGCSRDTNVTNWLDSPNADLAAAGEQGMAATEGGADDSDSISLRFANSPGDIVVEQVPSTNAAPFRVNDASQLEVGQIVMLSDCSTTDVVQITNIQGQGGGGGGGNGGGGNGGGGNGGGGGGGSETVVHNPGGTETPGNTAPGLSSIYPNGANVFTFQSVRYSVVDNGVTFELQRDVNGNTSTIASGVRQLQLEYGYDPDRDGIAEFYGDADAGAPQNVVSVRIRMLVQNQRDGVATEQQSVDFNGGTVNIPDNRMAQVFSATVAVRNRLP